MEAAERSGSLITADQALEMSRDVFAVPGPISSPKSAGTNGLIRQGAKLVATFEDIMEEYEGMLDFQNRPLSEGTRGAVDADDSLDENEAIIYRILNGRGALRRMSFTSFRPFRLDFCTQF